MNNEEYPSEKYIPYNYKGYLNISIFSFKKRNLIEGLIYGLILGAILFLIFAYYNYGVNETVISATIVGFIAGFVGGMVGMNNESVSEAFVHMLRWLSKRRTVFYNPRVKKEARSAEAIQMEGNTSDMIPRERILLAARKVVKKLTKKDISAPSNTEHEADDEFINYGEVIFEDDDVLKTKKATKKSQSLLKKGGKTRGRKKKKAAGA